jgi:uncharacterized protein (TIGR02217 family)
MSFHDISLPNDIAYGFEGGPGFSTVVQPTASGHEYRASRQAQGRHAYRCRKELLTDTQRAALKAFWVARRGHLHGFRFKDWQDYSTGSNGTGSPAMTDVVLGTGDGTRTQFQLIKTYDPTGFAPYARTLSLPVAGSVVAALDGSSASPTVSNPGGVLTFGSAPGNGVVVSAGCQFDTPVRFNVRDEKLASQLRDFGLTDWDFELQEILDEVETPERRYAGGSLGGFQAISADVAFTPGVFLHPWNPTGSLNAYLPPPDRLEGGEHFLVLISSLASGTVQIRDDAGNTLAGALASGASKRVGLIRDGSTAQWVAY